MIDTHMHFNANGGAYDKPADYDLRALRPYDDVIASIVARIELTLSRYTCAGVTSVLAVGDPRWQFDIRHRANTLLDAPHVFVVGPFIAHVPVADVPMWTKDDPALVQAADSTEARRIVRELFAQHVDLIKNRVHW
jgi:hypothetical protein